MRVFFDRCAPIALARMVRAIDKVTTVQHHDEDERFNPKTPDIEWMKVLCDDGDPLWIVLSGDGHILRNRAERKVLDEVRLPYCCLSDNFMNFGIYDQAWRLIRVWPEIVKTANQKNARGGIFHIRCGASLKIERV